MFKNWKHRHEIAELKQMMRGMAAQGNWNLRASYEWSFFFFSDNESHLDSIGRLLVSQGYQIRPEMERDEDEEPETFMLVVDKFERLTATQLFERTQEFEELANKYEGVEFDGWEFGPPFAESLAAIRAESASSD